MASKFNTLSSNPSTVGERGKKNNKQTTRKTKNTLTEYIYVLGL
jgi:hypothetical protein